MAIINVPLSLVHVYNYLDPGTGSLILQLLIGVLVGGWFVIKNYWKRIKLFLNKLFKRKVEIHEE